MLLYLSCLLGKKKQQQTSIGLNRAIGTKPVKAFIIGLPVANRKMSRIYVEKRQNGGRISEKALRVLFPLQWDQLLRGEGPCVFTMNSTASSWGRGCHEFSIH